MTEEDLEDVDSEDNSLLGKFKKLIPKKKTVEVAEDEEEVVADDAEAARKKRVSLMIRVFIGLLLVLFLLEEYIFPPEETVPEAPPITAPVDTNIQDEPAPDAPIETTETPVETVETPVEPTVTETTVAPSDGPTEEPEGPAVTDTETTSPDPDTDLATTPLPTEDTPEDLEPSLDTTTTTTFTEDPASADDDQASDSADISEDIIGEGTPDASEDDLTDKILQDLEKQVKTKKAEDVKKEYVAPPNYEYRGRGLVYNCQGKHWACVDGPSYKTCEDNASSLKYLKKPAECYPFNVYETVKGCEGTQYRMVSSSAKTSFCQEN